MNANKTVGPGLSGASSYWSDVEVTPGSSIDSATVGTAYALTMQAVGGTAPYTWGITHAIPNTGSWLSIDAVTGILSGMPGTAETETVVVTVTDSASDVTSGTLVLTVNAALTASPSGTTIPDAAQIVDAALAIWTVRGGIVYTGATPVVGSSGVSLLLWYNGQIYQQIGPSFYRWSGTVWGSPIGDPRGAGNLSITTSTLPGAVVGTSYQTAIGATGGTSPYTWALTSSSPDTGAWLAIDANTGVLSGTPGTAETETSVVTVTDAIGRTASTVVVFIVASAPVASTSGTTIPAAPQIIDTALAVWTLVGGVVYKNGVAAGISSGVGLLLWYSGTMYKVSGGAYYSWTGSAWSLVNGDPRSGGPTITNMSALPSATTTVAYSAAMAATGGVLPYSWAITSDTPDTGSWLSLNSSTGVLSGTPGTAETETVGIQLTDYAGHVVSGVFSIIVAAVVVASPSGTTIPSATQILDASLVVWTVVGGVVYKAGALAGFTAGVALLLWYGGTIYQEAGGLFYPWTGTTWGASGPDPRGTFAITNSSPLAGATTTTPYTDTMSTSGGTAPYVWSITSDTPDTGSWLSINASTGVLSGTPGTAETETVVIHVTDSVGHAVSGTFSIVVAAHAPTTSPSGTTIPSATQIIDTGLAVWTVVGGVVYKAGVLAGYSAGVTLLLWYSGTMYQLGGGQFYPWTGTAWGAPVPDPRGTGPVISNTSPLPGATRTTAYTAAMSATGGTLPYVWSITSDTPNTGSWLTINSSTGELTGTPGTAETETVVIKVVDALARTVSGTFALVVAASGTGTTSPNGTTVPPAANLVDTALAVWTVVGGVVYKNGVIAGVSAGVTLLLWYGGVIYQLGGGLYYPWTGTAWGASQGDPRVVAITTARSLYATTGIAYSQTMAATGGTAPYTWAIISDTPNTGNWLSINASTGVLSGTPLSAESESVSIKVTDSASQSVQVGFTLLVQVPGVGGAGRKIIGSKYYDLNGNQWIPQGAACAGGEGMWQMAAWPNMAASDWKALAVKFYCNHFRLPVNSGYWNHNSSTGGSMGYRDTYLDAIAKMTSVGIVALLDNHWMAPNSYNGGIGNGQGGYLSQDSDLTFWIDVATRLGGNRLVVFELQNELNGDGNSNGSQYAQNGSGNTVCTFYNQYSGQGGTSSTGAQFKVVGYNQLVAAIRAAGAPNICIAGQQSMNSDATEMSNRTLMPSDTVAPAGWVGVWTAQIAVSIHYCNGGGDGPYNTCLAAGVPIWMTEYRKSDGSGTDANLGGLTWMRSVGMGYSIWSVSASGWSGWGGPAITGWINVPPWQANNCDVFTSWPTGVHP